MHKLYADITSIDIRDLSIHGFWNPRWGGGSWNQFTVNKLDDCIYSWKFQHLF